jgi:cysteinyl-tRNA synthetase
MIAIDLFKRRRARKDNGKNFQFTDAARNKLRVLRTEVEDDNGLGFHEQFCPIRGVL